MDANDFRDRAFKVKNRIYTTVAQLTCEGWRTAEPLPYSQRTEGEHITPAVGEERERLWQRWRELDKNLDAYAARRPRETAVVVLEPRSAAE
jgi:crotonobetainyl-CoA:carnitine CoA-transferase CaiB-like acyl-CoA transferase